MSFEQKGQSGVSTRSDIDDAHKVALSTVIEIVNAARRVGIPGVIQPFRPDKSAAGRARAAFGDKGDSVDARRRIANLATAYVLDKRLHQMSAEGTLGLARTKERSPTDILLSKIPGEQKKSDKLSSMLTPLVLMEVTRPLDFYKNAPPNEQAFGTRVLLLLTRWYNYVGSTLLVTIDNSGESMAVIEADVEGQKSAPEANDKAGGSLECTADYDPKAKPAWRPPPIAGQSEYEHFTPGSFFALDQRAGGQFGWVFQSDWTASPEKWARW
jgi:hypothetical protein